MHFLTNGTPANSKEKSCTKTIKYIKYKVKLSKS